MEKFKTFNTSCSQCDQPLKVAQFNVHVGATSFALCPKHLEALEKMLKKIIPHLFYD